MKVGERRWAVDVDDEDRKWAFLLVFEYKLNRHKFFLGVVCDFYTGKPVPPTECEFVAWFDSRGNIVGPSPIIGLKLGAIHLPSAP